jgi:hypothetical protein
MQFISAYTTNMPLIINIFNKYFSTVTNYIAGTLRRVHLSIRILLFVYMTLTLPT